jgi:excinuclease ABC subunit A
VRLRGRDIGQILSLDCSQALAEFAHHPKIAGVLAPMVDAGLGYLPLGFPSQDLSGGELARLRLCARLSGAAKARLFVLDEPTCGLHPQDTLRLVRLLAALCGRGHTVLAISHDPVLLSRCDWLCELGPGAGDEGGRTLMQGDPWTLAEADVPSSQSLRAELSGGSEKNDLLPP